jgi:hypothetical protein
MEALIAWRFCLDYIAAGKLNRSVVPTVSCPHLIRVFIIVVVCCHVALTTRSVSRGSGHRPDAISITRSPTAVPLLCVSALSCTHDSGNTLCVSRKPCAIASRARHIDPTGGHAAPRALRARVVHDGVRYRHVAGSVGQIGERRLAGPPPSRAVGRGGRSRSPLANGRCQALELAGRGRDIAGTRVDAASRMVEVSYRGWPLARRSFVGECKSMKSNRLMDALATHVGDNGVVASANVMFKLCIPTTSQGQPNGSFRPASPGRDIHFGPTGPGDHRPQGTLVPSTAAAVRRPRVLTRGRARPALIREGSTPARTRRSARRSACRVRAGGEPAVASGAIGP